MIVFKIVIFILGLIIGMMFLIYAEPIVRTFGKAAWAERHFRTLGGSYLIWKIVGLIIIVLTFLYLVGSLDWLIHPQ